jgi:hypothetical protein
VVAVGPGNVPPAAAAECKGAIHQEGELLCECSKWTSWAAKVQRQWSKHP